MLSCLPLVVGIRAQEHLGVGFINLEMSGFLACLGKRRIIEFLLHKQIRIFCLQALDGGQFVQRQIVKCSAIRFIRGAWHGASDGRKKCPAVTTNIDW